MQLQLHLKPSHFQDTVSTSALYPKAGLLVPSNVDKRDGRVETLNSGGETLKHFRRMWLKFQAQEEEAENGPCISSYSEKQELKREAQLLLLGAAGNVRGCVCWIYFLRIIL